MSKYNLKKKNRRKQLRIVVNNTVSDKNGEGSKQRDNGQGLISPLNRTIFLHSFLKTFRSYFPTTTGMKVCQ